MALNSLSGTCAAVAEAPRGAAEGTPDRLFAWAMVSETRTASNGRQIFRVFMRGISPERGPIIPDAVGNCHTLPKQSFVLQRMRLARLAFQDLTSTFSLVVHFRNHGAQQTLARST